MIDTELLKPKLTRLKLSGILETLCRLRFLLQSLDNENLGRSGFEACLRGFDTIYRNTHDLFRWITSGQLDGSHERRLSSVKSIPLLILDDFGPQSLSDPQQEDLYELISHRHELMTTIITSNRDFKEWPLVFSNPLMGSAAMDRLVHRALRLTITGASYRLKTFIDGSSELSQGDPLADALEEAKSFLTSQAGH